MSAPADRIYVSPASVVGSIGVRGVVPPQGTPNGEITTGPDKGSTSTTAEARRRVETLRRAFVGAVTDERDEELELTREEISYAKVYSGARGVELGLADEVGGIDTAVDDAAQRAGLSEYETVRMESPTPNVLSQIGLNFFNDTATTEMTFEYTGVDTVQYLMIHGQLHTPETATTIEVTANDTN
jgi:protease-4